MVYRIEIKSKIPDSRNLVMMNKIKGFSFEDEIKDIKIVDVYTLNSNFNEGEVAKIADMDILFSKACPENEIYLINKKEYEDHQ